MLLALLLLITPYQDGAQKSPEEEEVPQNAQIVTDRGERIYLLDVQVKGMDPHHFEFQTEGQGAMAGSSFVNIRRITRITRLNRSGRYEIMFDSGEKQVGKIRSLTFKGKGPQDNEWRHLNINSLDKIFLVSGARLRSCNKGHFEKQTLYPFCPMCGSELNLGGYRNLPNQREDQIPTHRLRLNTRNR